MAVPMLTALDAVYDAIQNAAIAGTFAGYPLSVVRTMRPLQALERIDEGMLAIVYPMEATRNPTATNWDEYEVTIAVDLITPCTSVTGDEHQEERALATLAQAMCDAVRTALSVNTGYTGGGSASGILEEGTREELNLISATFTHRFRIMHGV